VVFFVQAEDGIRDGQESRGLGYVYKRQKYTFDGVVYPSKGCKQTKPRLSFSIIGAGEINKRYYNRNERLY